VGLARPTERETTPSRQLSMRWWLLDRRRSGGDVAGLRPAYV
jgi:hypothetical protein